MGAAKINDEKEKKMKIGEQGDNELSSSSDAASSSKSKIDTTATATATAKDDSPKEKNVVLDVETGLECKDSNDMCPFLAATGKCQSDKEYMNARCRKSCNRCHIVRVNSK